jgi:hypothetical protein
VNIFYTIFTTWKKLPQQNRKKGISVRFSKKQPLEYFCPALFPQTRNASPGFSRGTRAKKNIFFRVHRIFKNQKICRGPLLEAAEE